MPRGKEEEVIEQSLTARVTSRKRGATKQWQEADEVRKHAKLSSKQVAKNAKDKLSSVLNKVKRDEAAKMRAMSPREKKTYQAEKRQEKRQEKERSKETARVEASVEAHSSAWCELPTLLAATEAELARTGKGVAAVVTATALQAQIETLGGGIDTPDGMFPMGSYVGIDFTYSVPLDRKSTRLNSSH